MSAEYRYQCAICGTRVMRRDILCCKCSANYGVQIHTAWLQALLEDEQQRRVRYAMSQIVDVTTVQTDNGLAEDIEDVLEFSATTTGEASYLSDKSRRRNRRWKNIGVQDCVRR